MNNKITGNKKNILIIIILLFLSFSIIYAETKNENLINWLFNVLKFNPSQQKKSTPQSTSSISYQQQPFLKPLSIYNLEEIITKVINQSSSAVVSIVISKYVPIIERYYINPFEEFNIPPELKPFFEFHFEVPQYKQKGYEKQKIGGGTGFIISPDGLILTNKHVVSDQNAEYTVYLNDGRKFQAKVLILHPTDDLALLKIDAQNLPVLTLGDSDNIKLGQFVIAIGNALGEFQNTVSFGIISGLRRSITASDNQGNIERLEGLIQTDAAINYGNSGGPLINLRGEVIGINTAIAGGAENIGFAIPVNRAKKMIEDYKTRGKIEIPFLGIYYVLINEEIQKRFNLPVDYGAYIYNEKGSAIFPNSPAELYGLRDKDIILEVDGEKITYQNSLAQIITRKNVGDRVKLKVLRNNEEFILIVVLGSLPKDLAR